MKVIGTASEHNHDYLRSIGATPVTYGEGLLERVRSVAPDGVDAVLDASGRGEIPLSIELTGNPKRVLTLVAFDAAETGIQLHVGGAGSDLGDALRELVALTVEQQVTVPVLQTYPLAEIAQALRVSREGHVTGKIVVLPKPSMVPHCDCAGPADGKDDTMTSDDVASARQHSVGDLLRRTALRYPNKLAVVGGEYRMTYAEFDASVNRCARALADRGLGKGDRLALLSHNCWQYAVLAFATARLGVVLVPVNFMLGADEIAYILTHSEAADMVTEDALAPTAEKALASARLAGGIRGWIGLIGRDADGRVGERRHLGRHRRRVSRRGADRR